MKIAKLILLLLPFIGIGCIPTQADLDAKVKVEVKTQVEAALVKITTDIDTTVESKVETKMEADISTKVDSKVEASLSAKVDTKVEAAVNSRLDATVTAKVSSALKNQAEQNGKININIGKIDGLTLVLMLVVLFIIAIVAFFYRHQLMKAVTLIENRYKKADDNEKKDIMSHAKSSGLDCLLKQKISKK